MVFAYACHGPKKSSGKPNYYVGPNQSLDIPEVWLDYGEDAAGDDAWRLYVDNRLDQVFPTKGPGKKAAKRAAEKLVKRDGYAELMIYKKDGQIQTRKTLTRDDSNAVGGFDIPGL